MIICRKFWGRYRFSFFMHIEGGKCFLATIGGGRQGVEHGKTGV